MPPMKRNSNAVIERIKALKRKWAREGAPCHLCLQPIDYSLPQGHPGAVEADHVVPIAQGGHPLGQCLASHRRCNQSRQHRSIDEFRASRNVRIDEAGKPTDIPEVKRPMKW